MFFVGDTYVGFMLVILLPSEDGIHSLSMKSPVGWVYVRPLGAVRVTSRLDGIVTGGLVDSRWARV